MWFVYDRCQWYLVTLCFFTVEDKLVGSNNNVPIFDTVRDRRAAPRAVFVPRSQMTKTAVFCYATSGDKSLVGGIASCRLCSVCYFDARA